MTWKTRAFVLVATLIGSLVIGGAVWADPPLPTITAGEDSSNAFVLGVPGVLTVAESNATDADEGQDTASWSAVSIAGTSVIGRSGEDQWSGAAAPAGAVIDGVNGILCPVGGLAVPIPMAPSIVCVNLLPSRSRPDNSSGPFADGALVGAVVFSETPQGTYFGIVELVGSQAFNGPCFDGGQTWLSRGDLNTPDGPQSLDIELTQQEVDRCR